MCLSQDLIIKKDGGEIEGKVVEITLEEVKYQSSSNSESPLISLPIGELLLVKFANGKNHVFKEQGPKYKLGQEYGGGIIFYIDQTGEHGLIVSGEDYHLPMKWGKAHRRIGASSMTNGASNTKKIAAEYGSQCAAGICENLIIGGFDDWYLPAIEELSLLYKNRDHVTNIGVLNTINGRGISKWKTDYISSTEYSNRNDCMGVHFSRNGKVFYYNKREKYRVRAIRKF